MNEKPEKKKKEHWKLIKTSKNIFKNSNKCVCDRFNDITNIKKKIRILVACAQE